MFTFGTNDFGFKGCRYNETVHDTLYDGCECRCQILTHPNGTCKQGLSGSPEYRLYKIQKGKIIVIGTCDKSHKECQFRVRMIVIRFGTKNLF